MSDEAKSGKPRVSRRTALSAMAGIGVTVAAGSVTQIASAAETPAATVAGPVVVRLRDLASGQLDVFTGSSCVQVQDKELAARMMRAAAQA